MASAFSKKGERLKEKLENRGLRAKAPIAAQFEDCVQAIQQLSDSLQVKLSGSALRDKSKECHDRLVLWADESGASSRLLDYMLRQCPALQRQTLRHLEELHTTLEEVIAEVLLQYAADGGGESEDSVADVQGDTTGDFQRSAALLADAVVDLTTADAEVGIEAEAEALLSEAEDIVSGLFQLMPALRDPFEQNENGKTSSEDRHKDIPKDFFVDLAHVLFPSASESLANTFAMLNVQRTLAVLPLREVKKTSRRYRQDNARNALKGLSSFFGVSQQPDFSQQASWAALQHQSTRAESDGGTSTIRSHTELHSKSPSLGQTSATSVSVEVMEPSIMQCLALPPVPVVDLSTEKQFECPYCQSDLPLTFSSECMVEQDWEEHVYHDLKPYVCTFDGCSHQKRPTGNRQQWFLHELSCHRLQLVWNCGLCRENCQSAEAFETHLTTRHPALSDEDCLLVHENCRTYSLQDPPFLDCKVCSRTFSDPTELECHVGRHLEAYALAAWFRNDFPDEVNLGKTDLLDEFLQDLDKLHHPVRETVRTKDEDHSDASTINASIATDVDQAEDSVDAPGMAEVSSATTTDGSDKVRDFLDRQRAQAPISEVRSGIPERFDNFVGRDQDLDAMYNHLSSPGRVCTISGRGGIGKTALGVEYVHKYGPEYTHVFWVESDNPGICAEKYGNIATILNITEKPLVTEDTRTFSVKDYLTRSEVRWLLIFDNVASWKDVSRYIPRTLASTKGSVLITTRTGPLLAITPAHPIYHRQHAVKLDVWPLEHGREFLLTSIQPRLNKEDVKDHEEYDVATQVVEVVGRLPLAISMIVGYIKVSRCSLSDFMEMWEEKEHITKKKRKRNMNMDSSDVDSTIDSLWTIGIREVRMNSRRLLDVLSFLDPDTVQKHLLVGDHKEEYLEFLNSSETISYKRMIHELSGRRLIAVRQLPNGGEAYNIHRLLQQKVLMDMEDLGFVGAYRKAFRLIRKRFPVADTQQVPDPISWAACSEYMPHIFTLHRVHVQSPPPASTMEMNPVEIAELFYDAGFYIWSSQTNSYDGLSFLRSAAATLDDSGYDKNAKIRADILCVHGLLLLNMGCVERSEGPKLLKQALDIRQRIYQEDTTSRDGDVLLQNAANDWALCLLNDHKFQEAGGIIKKCRDRYRLWGSEEENPFENSKYYGNYSVVLMWMGDLDEAIRFQERALQLTEQFAGRNAQYYRRAFMLGCYFVQKGDFHRALEQHLEVLTARLEMQGKHHESTMLSMYAVGATYHHLEKPKLATDYLQQCFEFVKNSWWDRVAMARLEYHLAVLYREQGVEDKAALKLEASVAKCLDEFSNYISDAVRGSDDKLMILDDLQPTFLGRYTGVKLLKHLAE